MLVGSEAYSLEEHSKVDPAGYGSVRWAAVLKRDLGWSFWWRWVVATNLGWFTGISIGLAVASLLPASAVLGRACTAAAVAATLFGGTQAFVLRAFLPTVRTWWLLTVIGWTVGVGIARLALASATASLHPMLDAAAVGFIAGAVAGLPQAWALSRATRWWPWWPLVSAVGWGILFPGALPGLVLARLALPEATDPQRNGAADTS